MATSCSGEAACSFWSVKHGYCDYTPATLVQVKRIRSSTECIKPLTILCEVTMHMLKADSKCTLAHMPRYCMNVHMNRLAVIAFLKRACFVSKAQTVLHANTVAETRIAMLACAIEDTVQATQASLGMHPHCVAETQSYADSTLHVDVVVCTTGIWMRLLNC